MLDYEELEQVLDKVTEKIILANREGNLYDILLALGLEDYLAKDSDYKTYKEGKIAVIGESRVKEADLLGIIKSLDLDKNRFEFCLDYKKAKSYDYKKMHFNPNYRLVLFGPVPHSSSGKFSGSSVITNMEKTEGYPRVMKLISNKELKITKNNFKEALQKLKNEEYI